MAEHKPGRTAACLECVYDFGQGKVNLIDVISPLVAYICRLTNSFKNHAMGPLTHCYFVQDFIRVNINYQ